MKINVKYFAILLFTCLNVACYAQVKQVFQVLHFDTKQPIVGATNTLYVPSPAAKEHVVTLTTNAQGIAVVTLPADMKGEYLSMDGWRLDGYTNLGRAPENLYSYYQTKDTIRYYMVEKQTYRKERQNLFEQLYRYHYREDFVPVSTMFRDTVKAHPELAKSHVNKIIEATFDNVSTVSSCEEDAESLNKYDFDMYYEPQFNEVLLKLRSGDVNKAVEIIQSHIDLKDNSYNNMRWINLYRDVMFLEYAPESEEPLCTYSEVLYRNNYSNRALSWYIVDLERNGEYAKADSLIRLEKANNKNPRLTSIFCPSFVQYLNGSDNAKLKSVSEDNLQAILGAYQKYPDKSNMYEVFWIYKNLYYTYLILEDTTLATRTIDSAMAYAERYVATYDDQYGKNQQTIEMMQDLLTVVTVDAHYIADSLLYQIYEKMYEAAKTNYDQDTTNLFLQLQLAECALRWIKESPEPEDNAERHNEVLSQLVDIEFKLSKEFPDYYPVQNVQITSQLLAQRLLNPSSDDQIKDAFRQYEKSFDVVNAQFPKAFIGHYLRFNSLLEGFLTSNQQFVLTSEISDFTDRLLNIKADNDPQKFLVVKAEYANEMAESLFEDELYEEAVAYYLLSNEYYEKAVRNDDQLWIPYLTNYLQMGDAHLYQNQYDKALMTYKTILDFEPQIPASVMPKYTLLKGSVYYYNGDIYRAMDDLKRAEKEYKTAEKYYKKAVALGNTDAYMQLGEMYWGKAVMASRQGNIKKCKQFIEQSVAYYESTTMERPLKTYLRAKSVLADFYKQENNVEKYRQTMSELTDFYRQRVDYSDEFASKLVENAEEMLNSDLITKEEALVYSRDILVGLLYLNDAGEDVQLPYLRGMFNMARVYTANDSVLQAIDLYRSCLELNEVMFKDTAEETYKSNMVEVYIKMASCYVKMAEDIDSAHSELWYYRAIDVRDTLIDLLKDLASDGDVNMTYRLAMQYKNNAMTFNELDMIPSAQDYLDKSNEQLLMLYNSEYKAEVEDDVIKNYYLKAAIYSDNDNVEKAMENYRKAIEYGDDSDMSEGVSPFYYLSIMSVLEELEKDKDANATEIAKLKKKAKAAEGKLKRLF